MNIITTGHPRALFSLLLAMMKPAVLLLAFAALAVSLPSDVPETFVEVATAELALPPAADVMDVVSPKVLPSPSQFSSNVSPDVASCSHLKNPCR